MRVFNQEVIESFAEPCSEEVSTSALEWAENTLTEVIEEIRLKRPVVSVDYTYFLTGDFFTGATTVNSQIDIYLCLKSPQLELNTMKLVNNRWIAFWKKVKNAWVSSRQEKKKKKKKQAEQELKEIEIPINKYSIADFKQELINKLLPYLAQDGYIYVYNTGFKIVSREQIGMDINVFPVIANLDTFKLYNSFTNKFIEVDFGNRENNIQEKLDEVGEIFIDLIRIYNNLYFNINNLHANQILIESLLYNIPSELFFGYSLYEIFMKTLNYLKNANISTFVSITDKNKKMFQEKLIGETLVFVSNFIKNIDKMV